jgi:hypothetical protein
MEIKMYYVCIENGLVTSVLNYYPNVPASVSVIQISEAEYESLNSDNAVFDMDLLAVRDTTEEEKNKIQVEKSNNDRKEFLKSTDWKVLRHIREKALGNLTSLSEEEYLELEKQRELAAKSIV